MKITRKVQHAGRCIFCGGAGLTKELIFPNWMRTLFPRDHLSTHTLGTVTWPGGQQVVRTKRLQGHSGTKQLRVVCQKCNNTWMSVLELRVKPHLIALARGEAQSLPAEAQRDLALWVAMKACVAENLNPEQKAIRHQERNHIHSNQALPAMWNAFVMPYEGGQYSEPYLHQHVGRFEVPHASGPGPLQHYVEATTLVIGGLVMLVVATSWPLVAAHMAGFDMPDVGFYRIATDSAVAIDWQPEHAVADEQVEMVFDVLRHVINVTKVISGT